MSCTRRAAGLGEDRGGDSRGSWRRACVSLGACCATTLFATTLGAGSAWAGGTAYVAELEAGKVSQFAVGSAGALTPLLPATVAAGEGAAGVAISPDARNVYVANSGTDQTISQYDVGAGGGLSPKSPPTVMSGHAGFGPYSIAVSPDGKSVYAAGYFTGVTQYDVGAGGALSPKSPETVPAGAGTEDIAASPDGRSVYVSDFAGDTISQFDVGVGGALSPKSPATVPAGNSPSSVAITPDGKNLYVSDVNGEEISQYDVGPGGALSPKSPPTVTSGHFSQGIAISPDGSTVYVANESASGIERYGVQPGGALSFESETPTAKEGPHWIALSPDGRSLYATVYYGNVLNQYDVQPGGALSSKAPATVTTEEEPEGIAVLPDQAPLASFAHLRARPGVPLTFNGSASSDPDGSVARFDWSFGDGQTAANAGPSPTHTYTRPGNYMATLSVTDNEGCSTTPTFTGQTAYCNGQASASQTQSIQVAYPGVRVKCPKRAKPKGCRFNLQAVTMKPPKNKRKKVKTESALAKAKLKGGGTTIVSLKPKQKYAARLGAAAKILVRETVAISGSERVSYRKLKVVR